MHASPDSSLTIRPIAPEQFALIWPIWHEVARRGDTYSYAPDSTFDQARAIWCAPEKTVYVAELNGQVAGTFYLRANHDGLGAHVANAGFMVSPDHRAKGIGRAMGMHALAAAKEQGFHAIQFNYVVSTNTHAVALWQSLGFDIIGTIPQGFAHSQHGLVDVYIMYRTL